MNKNFYRLWLFLALLFPLSASAIENSEAADADSEIAIQPDALILKDEDPLKVNMQLGKPEKIVNLRAVQKEVLSIALPEESPEEVEERAPVEE